MTSITPARRLPLPVLAPAVLALLALLTAGCTSRSQPSPDGPSEDGDAAVAEPVDPEVRGAVLSAFATYRAGVEQGDPEAVLGAVTSGSLEHQAEIARLAREASPDQLRAAPAVDQLIALTYRLQPDFLAVADPFVALVDAGLAGQDRSLGELGEVQQVTDDVVLGEVLPGGVGPPAAERWRFRLEDGEWRFDLAEALRIASDRIAAAADGRGIAVHQLVTTTLAELSGEQPAVIEALYSTPSPAD